MAASRAARAATQSASSARGWARRSCWSCESERGRSSARAGSRGFAPLSGPRAHQNRAQFLELLWEMLRALSRGRTVELRGRDQREVRHPGPGRRRGRRQLSIPLRFCALVAYSGLVAPSVLDVLYLCVNIIVILGFSIISRQVLHFFMCNFLSEDNFNHAK